MSTLPHRSMRRPRSCWKLTAAAEYERDLGTDNESTRLKNTTWNRNYKKNWPSDGALCCSSNTCICLKITNLKKSNQNVKILTAYTNTPEESAYHKARGSQSLNGISSLAACLTSSSSTIPLTRCSTCRLATLSHSTSGGRWECALQGKQFQRLSLRFDLLWHKHNCFTVLWPPKCQKCPRRSGANTSWNNTKSARHLMPSPREISACYLYSGTPRRNVVEPVKQARSVQPLMSHMW